MVLKAKSRGGERTQLFSCTEKLLVDLSHLLVPAIKNGLGFHQKEERYFLVGHLVHLPARLLIPVEKTMDTSAVEFFPLDTYVSAKDVALFINTDDTSGLKPQIEQLAKAHADNYNARFNALMKENFELKIGNASPTLLLGRADSVLQMEIGLGYLFLVGSPEEGYRLESECSFKFVNK